MEKEKWRYSFTGTLALDSVEKLEGFLQSLPQGSAVELSIAGTIEGRHLDAAVEVGQLSEAFNEFCNRARKPEFGRVRQAKVKAAEEEK